MKARLTIPLVLWALAASSVAAATIQFEASVDRTRASQSEPIRLTLRITSDKQLSQVTPAFELKDFHVEGPATSTRMEMRNTDITFSRDLTYILYAKRVGTLTIGPMQLEMDGERYETKPITVEIVQGASRSQAGQADDPPIFVLARADHKRAYVGQQVTVSYDLFYRIQPRNVSFNKLPTFVGFWTEDLFVAQQLESHQEMRGGASYNVAPLRRVALFPTGAGTHAVGTLAVSCDIPQQRSGRGGVLDDFFAGDPFFGRSRSVLLQSEELQIEVLPLPEQGRPAEFTGAVGRFQLSVEAQPTQVAVGDPVTLRVLIEGEGNMASVQPLQVDAATGVKLYDPKVEEEERITNGVYGGRRLFEYILIPEQGGTLNIPPLRFAYFDPHQARYEVLKSAPITIHSEGSAEDEGVNYGLSRRDIEAVGEDIRYIKPDAEILGA